MGRLRLWLDNRSDTVKTRVQKWVFVAQVILVLAVIVAVLLSGMGSRYGP
jgi:hypothetical protein